ncbi:MAG: bifunctional nuclease family protein [Prevotella sp.]|nr:bifunctional nuclease family protein [Prevotella sp.]
MERVRLIYKSLSEVVNSNGVGIITLTDETESRALNIVCDQTLGRQLHMRTEAMESCRFLLPEVMLAMLSDYVDQLTLEIVIYDVNDGQFLTTLCNTDNLSERKIRLSDAILLHLIGDIPIYIEKQLMASLSMPYEANMTKISIPINTLNTEKLKEGLERAIEEENYLLASNIKDELNRRSHTNKTE